MANFGGINFVAPSILNQDASPVPVTSLQIPTFLWEEQTSLNVTSLGIPAFLYEDQTPLALTSLGMPPFVYEEQTSISATFYTPGNTVNVVATVYYLQRVFSSGLGVWCYYTTTNAIDPTPLPAATIPNWTGSITGYELVTSYAA